MKVLLIRSMTQVGRAESTTNFYAVILDLIVKRAQAGYGDLKYEKVPTNICRDTLVSQLRNDGFAASVRPYAGCLSGLREWDVLNVEWTN
jgi:hypothetical protein